MSTNPAAMRLTRTGAISSARLAVRAGSAAVTAPAMLMPIAGRRAGAAHEDQCASRPHFAGRVARHVKCLQEVLADKIANLREVHIGEASVVGPAGCNHHVVDCLEVTEEPIESHRIWSVPELDEDYIARMEDVLETYERRYDPAEPVVCLDEKPITLHAEVRPVSPAVPGREARQDSEYERRGTANVFCAAEPKARRHFTYPAPDRTAVQFAQVAFDLATQYPEAKTIHLVMDNLNIHRRKSLTNLLGEEVGGEVWDRLTVHYTQTHGRLAQSGRDRNRHLLPAMPGQQKDSGPGDA